MKRDRTEIPQQALPEDGETRRGGFAKTSAWALGALALMIVLYGGLHSTILDEAWARPVSRGLQAVIAATAAFTLLTIRPSQPESVHLLEASRFARILALLLSGFAVVSISLPSPTWTRVALGFAVLWLLAAINEVGYGDRRRGVD